MQFIAVENPEQFKETNPKWRPVLERPLDRVLYIVYLGVINVLYYIGPSLDAFIDSDGKLEDELPDTDPTTGNPLCGVYVFEGSLHTIRYDTPNGSDYDMELVGISRLATKEEWQDWVNDLYPWDKSLWILPNEHSQDIV